MSSYTTMKWFHKRDLDRDNEAMLEQLEGSIQKQTRNPKQGNKAFRFLDLPPELRNEIYSKVLEDYFVTHLSRFTKDKTLLTDSSLVSVSKQVRAEFLDAMIQSSPIIRTRVRNLNFGSAIAFLNRLSDAENHKLCKDTKNDSRIMRVEFEFHMLRADRATSERLQRWLNRFDHPTKKGVNIKFEYEWRDHSGLPIQVRVTPRGPRSREELSKILELGAHSLKNF